MQYFMASSTNTFSNNIAEQLKNKGIYSPEEGKEEVLDIPELSIEFISDMRILDKTILESRYNISIEEEMTNLEVLEEICKSRKYLVRGGDYDYDRGAFAIISDFKHGKMGNITLEKVEDVKKLMKKDRKPSDA